MEANAARVRGDDLPQAVPVALFAAGMMLEAAAIERWRPEAPVAPSAVSAPRSRPARAAPAVPAAPPEAPAHRLVLRPRSCFPGFTVRFGAGEAHFPEAQVTQLTPLARWMSEHSGVTVTVRATLDGESGDDARQRRLAEMRLSTVTWRLIALGVPRDKVAEGLDVHSPRSGALTFSAGGFHDCPEEG